MRASPPLLVLACGILALSSGCSGPFPSDAVQVCGRVVDVTGSPVPGARIGTCWLSMFPHLARADGPIDCGEDGSFEATLPLHEDSVWLSAFSPDRESAGLVEVRRTDPPDDRLVIVRPVVHVHGRVACKGIDFSRLQIEVLWSPLRDGEAPPAPVRPGNEGRWAPIVARAPCAEGEFELSLPPGRYAWLAKVRAGHDGSSLQGMADLDRDRDLGEIDVPPPALSYFFAHAGEELPPWNVSASRGVPLERTSLRDFRGKWLLVEFWAYW